MLQLATNAVGIPATGDPISKPAPASSAAGAGISDVRLYFRREDSRAFRLEIPYLGEVPELLGDVAVLRGILVDEARDHLLRVLRLHERR